MSLANCLVVVVITASLLSLTSCEICTNRYGAANTGVCQLIVNCQGAALVGNCTIANHVCCIPNPGQVPNVPSNIKLTRSVFLRLVPNTPRNDFLYYFIVSSMQTAGLLTGSYSDHKVAAYLSQLVGESDYFRNLESNIYDDPDFDPILGNNQIGDGENFLGRGGILLRGRTNYLLANNSRTLNLGIDLIARPEQAAFPYAAFRIAAWFWKENAFVIKTNDQAEKGDLSQLVDGTFLNFTHITHALTNNIQDLKDRTEFNDRVVSEFMATNMKRGHGVPCEIGRRVGFAAPICLIDFQKPYCGCEGEINMRSCPYGYLEDGRTCRSSNMIKCCVERCSSAMDFVVVMDSSGSIGPENFRLQKNFVKNLLAGLNLGRGQTHVALINFNTRIDLLIDFMNFTDYETTASIIDNIFYNGGLTYTAQALNMANFRVLQEDFGMRSIESGTPRVVMVITDGLSENTTATLIEASRIKERDISIITVGIGKEVEIDIEELVGMASTPADQYFVNDFTQLSNIIAGLQMTTCQKAAEVPEQTQIEASVEMKSYRYYKIGINEIQLESNEFTIQLDILRGASEIYHSFSELYPKSPENFIDPATLETNKDGNFVEQLKSPVVSQSDDMRAVKKTKNIYYQIKVPQEPPNDILYFSVRGLDEQNEFRIYVHNKVVNFSLKLTSSSSFKLLALVFCFLIQWLFF